LFSVPDESCLPVGVVYDVAISLSKKNTGKPDPPGWLQNRAVFGGGPPVGATVYVSAEPVAKAT
jgi:hypothetical protein